MGTPIKTPTDPCLLVVNGQQVDGGGYAGRPLIEFLRDGLGLIGTKLGCGNGECGACTVLLDGMPICSCVATVAFVAERSIATIESLEFDPVGRSLQEAFVEYGGLQCGFCTPGMLMSATAMLRSNPHPTFDEIVQRMNGNVCRCTGYVQIVEAIQAAANHE